MLFNSKVYFLVKVCFVLFVWGGSFSSSAQDVHVAVATNFSAPIKLIAASFEEKTSYKVIVSTASSGKIYAQIIHGAPFDVFLSADTEKPQKLVEGRFVDSDDLFSYALGRLALWSKKEKIYPVQASSLINPRLKIAMANPRFAPYGIAAKQVLKKIQAGRNIHQQLLLGENITQAFQYVDSGNADIGFVAWTHLKTIKSSSDSSYWLIPTDFHEPILQQGVLLKRAKKNLAAKAFVNFMKTPEILLLIEKSGYKIPR